MYKYLFTKIILFSIGPSVIIFYFLSGWSKLKKYLKGTQNSNDNDINDINDNDDDKDNR